jgi:hypothetical protein
VLKVVHEKKIRAERDPHGLFVGYLADERSALER